MPSSEIGFQKRGTQLLGLTAMQGELFVSSPSANLVGLRRGGF